MLARGDKQLEDLQITVETRDEFNNNYNTVVDHACLELEAEIRKLNPLKAMGRIRHLYIQTLTLCF